MATTTAGPWVATCRPRSAWRFERWYAKRSLGNGCSETMLTRNGRIRLFFSKQATESAIAKASVLVLTDADAAADLAGTPRPDNPSV